MYRELHCVAVPFNLSVFTSASSTGDVLLLLMVSWTIVSYERRPVVSFHWSRAGISVSTSRFHIKNH